MVFEAPSDTIYTTTIPVTVDGKTVPAKVDILEPSLCVTVSYRRANNETEPNVLVTYRLPDEAVRGPNALLRLITFFHAHYSACDQRVFGVRAANGVHTSREQRHACILQAVKDVFLMIDTIEEKSGESADYARWYLCERFTGSTYSSWVERLAATILLDPLYTRRNGECKWQRIPFIAPTDTPSALV